MSALFTPTPPMRPLDPERDGPALHAIFSDEESCRYLPEPAFKHVEQTIEQMRKWTTGCEDTSWVTVDDQDRATGRISLHSTGDDIWNVGCMIAPHARGTGLARRALPPALDYVLDTKSPRRIAADIDPDNTASARTFEQLGFTYEGRLRATWKTHIGVRDSLIYSLLATDPRPWR